ncbi:hypothetical protein GUITHDRAFT_165712 [Guillardia theta CCMP2712]|uniref:HVA22-like protein n=1 Tax=Guillardia theta (strain CCMP2712) TaxID=905079 RepID=L1IK58_GUITC|nr:hypothetical protein GUITHDRAFT_165712 [Guillardia theta CCMP2712]EKX36502.1 hypothetical protein GUITHDRAFT_165712 [Guillardia theta CCMP2712]|eukprot:XP_005823482.1 hypothetical protein GUITHDRAFT_165712 [Guillardia theta CCMP2712]
MTTVEALGSARVPRPLLPKSIGQKQMMTLRGGNSEGGSKAQSGEANVPAASSSSQRAADATSAYWVIAGVITGLCLLSGQLAIIAGNIVGLAYPTYYSLKALNQSKQPGGELLQARLLTYWTCFALLQLVEGVVMPWRWNIPHYYAVKVVLLVWMHNEGARAIYNKWLKPLARTHEGKVEAKLSEAVELVQDRVALLKSITSHALRNFARSVIQSIPM